MTTLATAGYGGISIKDVQQIDVGKMKVRHISESENEAFERELEMIETMLEDKYSEPPDVSKNPAYQDYAIVVADNKVVATIDNNGCVATSGAVGGKLQDVLPGDVNGKSGPVLARARAEIIAKTLNGKVMMAATAISQNEFEAVPTPRCKINRAAMLADPAYGQIEQLLQARTLFLTHQLGQEAA